MSVRRPLTAALTLLLAAVLTGCTGTADPATSTTLVSSARCAENRAAGTITYLTGYGYAASPGIFDVLAASELGYFRDLCLTVQIEAGTGTNAALVSAGTAQIGNFGGASDVLTANAGGGHLVGIATYGNTGLARLIALKKNDYTLASFAGKVIGYHFSPPPQVEAMLVAAGVKLSTVRLVAAPSPNPLLLAQGSFDGMTGYVSADVPTLQAAGDAVTVWDPASYGVQSTFGTQAANATWAKAHPSAVEDFLRASFHAFGWLRASDAHVTTALGWAAAKQTSYDTTAERARWRIESGLVESTLPTGRALGMQSVAQWTPEAQELVRYGVLKTAPDIAAGLSTSYVAAISKDGEVVWPGP